MYAGMKDAVRGAALCGFQGCSAALWGLLGLQGCSAALWGLLGLQGCSAALWGLHGCCPSGRAVAYKMTCGPLQPSVAARVRRIAGL
eukprot:354698-Chlamydomonas_euryale.AAC.3